MYPVYIGGGLLGAGAGLGSARLGCWHMVIQLVGGIGFWGRQRAERALISISIIDQIYHLPTVRCVDRFA